MFGSTIFKLPHDIHWNSTRVSIRRKKRCRRYLGVTQIPKPRADGSRTVTESNFKSPEQYNELRLNRNHRRIELGRSFKYGFSGHYGDRTTCVVLQIPMSPLL